MKRIESANPSYRKEKLMGGTKKFLILSDKISQNASFF